MDAYLGNGFDEIIAKYFFKNCSPCFKLNSTQMGEESCSADFSLEESRRYADISYFFVFVILFLFVFFEAFVWTRNLVVIV